MTEHGRNTSANPSKGRPLRQPTPTQPSPARQTSRQSSGPLHYCRRQSPQIKLLSYDTTIDKRTSKNGASHGSWFHLFYVCRKPKNGVMNFSDLTRRWTKIQSGQKFTQHTRHQSFILLFFCYQTLLAKDNRQTKIYSRKTTRQNIIAKTTKYLHACRVIRLFLKPQISRAAMLAPPRTGPACGPSPSTTPPGIAPRTSP